jgi:hypothetical protein
MHLSFLLLLHLTPIAAANDSARDAERRNTILEKRIQLLELERDSAVKQMDEMRFIVSNKDTEIEEMRSAIRQFEVRHYEQTSALQHAVLDRQHHDNARREVERQRRLEHLGITDLRVKYRALSAYLQRLVAAGLVPRDEAVISVLQLGGQQEFVTAALPEGGDDERVAGPAIVPPPTDATTAETPAVRAAVRPKKVVPADSATAPTAVGKAAQRPPARSSSASRRPSSAAPPSPVCSAESRA